MTIVTSHFDVLGTHIECVPFGPTVIHHFGLRLPNLEKLIFRSGCLSLKAV